MTLTEPTPYTLDDLEEIIQADNELAALPQVVMRVIDLTDNPKATASDLEKAIGMDQALTARILTLANSSYFGLPSSVSSLREAVVFLGFKTLRNMAMTVTTFSLFLGKSDTDSLARRDIWRHSVDTAQCTRIITALLPPPMQKEVGADQAYTCALLHDIGKLALDRSRHELFLTLTQSSQERGIRFFEVEQDILPFSHSLIGARLAERWKLPLMLCEAISYHHSPQAAIINPELTASVYLANEVAHFSRLAPEKDADEENIALLKSCQPAMQILHLNEETLGAMSRACRTELEKGLSALAF